MQEDSLADEIPKKERSEDFKFLDMKTITLEYTRFNVATVRAIRNVIVENSFSVDF